MKCVHKHINNYNNCSILSNDYSKLMSKEIGPSTELTYIGYLFNTVDFTIGVPSEKRESTLKLLENFMSERKISIEDLESLIGKLQFNEKAVRKGRSYLYALRKQLVKAQKAKAQSWHRIKFSSDAKHELKWWHHALQHDSKVSLLHYVKSSMLEDVLATGGGRSSNIISHFVTNILEDRTMSAQL